MVVTGIGAVTGAGWGVGALRTALATGRTTIGPFSRFDHQPQRTHLASEVPALEEPPQGCGGWNRFSYSDRFALFATLEAVGEASAVSGLDFASAGVFFGSSTGGLFETERFYAHLAGGSPGDSDRALLASHQISAPAETVARRLRVSGPVETISSACASGALAIEQAFRTLRAGEIDLAIAGGADCLSLTTYAGFNALRAMDEAPCRPFGAGRAGMSLGEGGAALVLEPLDLALARGARPIAEILGGGASCDATHMTAPQESGGWAAAAMIAAIEDAGLDASAIDGINAHATGTPLNDAAEFAALERVFGERVAELPVEATKSIVGHLLGAAGAIEAVAAILSLLNGALHPNPGAGDVDEKLRVRLRRPGERAATPLRRVLSANFGFGGANAALVFGRWPHA